MLELTSTEEFAIRGNIQEPHFSYSESSVINRKRVSISILQRNITDILLIDSSGFVIDSIFAGLSEKHIEHIAKNGPRDYKENILKILKDKEMMRGVFEIAKAMDEDLGRGSVRHQERVKNVIQYIKDNQVAFEF